MRSKCTSRRNFLRSVTALLSGAGLSELVLSAADVIAQTPPYQLASWTGDDLTNGHRLRVGDLPPFPDKAEKSVDVVIIGGGVAGLACAYYLADADFLLLEQYDQLGGESIGKSYRGIDYSLGAAYLSSVDGIYGQLFDELKLKPIPLHGGKDAFYTGSAWHRGVPGSKGDKFYRQFKQLLQQCAPAWNGPMKRELNPNSLSSSLSSLDTAVFSSQLTGFDEDFVGLLNSLCKSSLCGGINDVSALAGFWALSDLVDTNYVLKGGNPALANALAAAIEKTGKGRLATNAFVWQVDTSKDKVSVVYSDRSGELHRIKCRHAIIAAPPLVAARIAPDLPDAAKALLLGFRYGAYLVANFCLRKKVFDGAYDNWVGHPFTFTDMVVAETPYELAGEYRKEMGSVLTLYQPYVPGSPGREQLLAGNREHFAAQILEQLDELAPELASNLDEVVLTRWGHAMVMPRPGTMKTLSKLAAIDTGKITLAHNSTYGFPSAHSAISAARLAANRALRTG